MTRTKLEELVDLDLTPLIASFGVIAVAELGDKTQLATVTLSTKYRARSVFIGAILAVLVVDGVSILIGSAVGNLLPMQWIGLLGAVIFIGFGAYSLYSKDDDEVDIRLGKLAIVTSFLLILVMELGDKTQFSALALAATYHSPVLVLLGTLLACVALMGSGVLIGSRLVKVMPKKYMKTFGGILFLIFGLIFLMNAAGITLF